MLNMEINRGQLLINGKKMHFQISYKEMNELGELLSNAFSLVYIKDEEGKEKCLENMSQYDDSKKEITLREVVTHVCDDEIDTDYHISLNGESVIFHRYAEWMPDDLESIFFRLCKDSIHTFATNYHIYYDGHCHDQICEFHKNDE